MKKTVVAIILCAVAIALGLSLPKIFAASKDDELITEVLLLDELEGNANKYANEGLSLADKIKIIGSADTSYVGIEYGRYRDEKDVVLSAMEFAELLNGAYINLYEIPEIENNYTVTASVATEKSGAGRSFICWNVTVTLGKDIIGFDVDDETGKVLKFTRVLPEQIGIAARDEASDCVNYIGNQLSEYYGFSFDGLDYPSDERTGVWRIRFTGDDEQISVVLDYNNYGWIINEMSYEETDETNQNDAEIIAN